MINNKRVLITGGAGFLGRHFTRKLLDLNNKVTIVDDLSSGKEPMDWMDKLRPSYNEHKMGGNFMFFKEDVRQWFTKHYEEKFDLVIHLAAVVGGRTVIEDESYKNVESIIIDSEFFKWARESGNKNIIFMSSPVVYPIAWQGELSNKDDMIMNLEEGMFDMENDMDFGMPDEIYGWAKVNGEYLAHTFAKKYGLNVLCLRPFSGYGEDQDLSYPIPAIAKRVVYREDPLKVWGSGEQTRDFIHVDDIVEGALTIHSKLDENYGYQVCNLGNSVTTSFYEVAKVASEIENYKPQIVRLKNKPEGVKHRVSDNTKMLKYYKPKIDFHTGMSKVIEYRKALKEFEN